MVEPRRGGGRTMGYSAGGRRSQAGGDGAHARRELPDRDRQVILRLLHGQNPADIARDFGCSRQRVEQIQSRAYRRLRRRLVPYFDPADAPRS